MTNAPVSEILSALKDVVCDTAHWTDSVLIPGIIATLQINATSEIFVGIICFVVFLGGRGYKASHKVRASRKAEQAIRQVCPTLSAHFTSLGCSDA